MISSRTHRRHCEGMESTFGHPEPFGARHSERSEESARLEGKLREGSLDPSAALQPQDNVSRVFFICVLSSVFFVLAFPGCGYTRKTVLPGEMKTIYVDTLKNEVPLDQVYAYVPGLEIDITNAIIRRLHQDGNLKVVPKEKADVVLDARLKRFEQAGLRFTSLESVEEYRLFIVLSLRLINNKTNQMIWNEPNFSGDAEYFVSFVRNIAREEASQRAIDRLARNVVDRIVEDW